jgi:hypothetical protein
MLMTITRHVWQVILAALALSATGRASADWLATDPGTPISVQLNMDGTLVIRPVGGSWTHPVCANTAAAVIGDGDLLGGRPLAEARRNQRAGLVHEWLFAAATSGSLVNLFADPEICDSLGRPVVRNIRVQAP